MVTFNRRYRPDKGYSRADQKREIEQTLDRELNTRGLPELRDDRGVAGLVFGTATAPDRPGVPLDRDAAWPPLRALEALAKAQVHYRADGPRRRALESLAKAQVHYPHEQPGLEPATAADEPGLLTRLWHRVTAPFRR